MLKRPSLTPDIAQILEYLAKNKTDFLALVSMVSETLCMISVAVTRMSAGFHEYFTLFEQNCGG